MLVSNNPIITAAVSVAAVVLGVPIAVVAILFEKVYMPNVTLGSKEINAGPSGPKTITFDLLSGPNDAVFAGAYISVVASVLVVIGMVLIRHITKHNVAGWVVFGSALANLLGQIGCLAYVFIVQGQHPEAKSTDEVRFVDGKYDTDGKLYTREAWACMMNNLYPEREGSWAQKACSDMKTGRLMTIPLVACGAILLGIAYWQVHMIGGFGWLIGRREKVAAAYKPKAEYIDLQS